MKILLAPDKFKGTLSAREVAEAMERGVRARTDATCSILPIADGGEGTLDALSPSREPGPVLAQVDGSFVIESAATFAGVEPTSESSLEASSVEVGRLMATALDAPGSVMTVVAVGGTMSTDGGTGAAAACGWRFLDSRGHDLPPGGGGLRHLARIAPPPDRPTETSVVGACDVDVPLTGPNGSARLFASQKGAGPDEILVLEEGLLNLAERMRADLGFETESRSHQGAGGGLGAGLAAFFGARLVDGFELVADRIGLDRAMERSDLVITGEGRIDRQSLAGKGPVRLARRAASLGVPCLAVVGSAALSAAELKEAGFAAVAESSLEDPSGPPAARVAAATERLLEGWSGH